MVVRNLHVVCVPTSPGEADPPLVIDANAVLSVTTPSELLQAIAGRQAEVVQRPCRVENSQLFPRGALEFWAESGNPLSGEHPPGLFVSE